eukprot:273278-Pyramimonas_sp.AAC.1
MRCGMPRCVADVILRVGFSAYYLMVMPCALTFHAWRPSWGYPGLSWGLLARLGCHFSRPGGHFGAALEQQNYAPGILPGFPGGG